MNENTVPVAPCGPGFDEEAARAELYGLASLLFYAPPSSETLGSLRVAVTQAPAAGAALEEPWRALVALARELGDEAIQTEYHDLFGGVGKPEVYLYASHYLSGFLNDRPLARLRSDLAALGLVRDESMPETEDHIAYVCEVMRYLIAGDDVALGSLARQQVFFATHVQSWVPALCQTLQKHPKARFYAALAELVTAFVAVEAQGFDMLD